MRKNKIAVSVFLLITLFLTISFPVQSEENSNLEKDRTEERDEENITDEVENSSTTETNSPEVKKKPDNEPSENKSSEESQVPKENKKENTEKSEDLNENPPVQENGQNPDSLEDSLQTDDIDTSEEDENLNSDSEVKNENSTNESTQETTETMQENNAQPRQGLIDATLLSDSSLDTSYSEDNSQIILSYEASGALDLSLLSNTYITFRLPSEIIDVITVENLSASYSVPLLAILGIVIPSTGEFDRDEEINIEGNQVYMNFTNLLSLNLLSTADYEFTLTIDLDERLWPPTETGEYSFMAEATDQLINLSLLAEENIATATLAAPQIPDAPVIEEPIYTTDTQVTGTGEPNTTINLQIGNEEYTDQVDGAGNFSVDIPKQVEGTEIQGSIVDGQGYESNVTTVGVTIPPDTTPPEPPDVDYVFSNDTIVNGRGEPGATVTLEADGSVIGEGVVVDSGNFSVNIPEQEPGTVISATLTDQAGNVSEPTEITVIEATVSFNQVPEDLPFKTTEIGSSIERIPRENSNWSLEVIDTRGEGSPFQLTAEANQPLTTVDGNHQLPDALVYVNEDGISQSLTNGAVEVYNGQTGEEPITSISWDDNQGPLIEMNTNDAYAETYQTDITWTLVDAP